MVYVAWDAPQRLKRTNVAATPGRHIKVYVAWDVPQRGASNSFVEFVSGTILREKR